MSLFQFFLQFHTVDRDMYAKVVAKSQPMSQNDTSNSSTLDKVRENLRKDNIENRMKILVLTYRKEVNELGYDAR